MAEVSGEVNGEKTTDGEIVDEMGFAIERGSAEKAEPAINQEATQTIDPPSH